MSGLMTTSDVARVLCIDNRTVINMLSAGRITPAGKRPGPKGAWLFDEQQIRELLDRRVEENASLDGEEWRPCPSLPGYFVSNLGRLANSFPDGSRRVLKGTPTKEGYRKFRLEIGGKANYYAHHLVAEAFYGPRPPGLEVRHLDGNAANNSAANLRYGTHSENELDKARNRREARAVEGEVAS